MADAPVIITNREASVIVEQGAGVIVEQRETSVVIGNPSRDAVYGDSPTFIQPTAPDHSGRYLWLQTGLGPNGEDFTIWFEDGQ